MNFTITTKIHHLFSHAIALIGIGIALFLTLFSCLYTATMHTADEFVEILKDSPLQSGLCFLIFLALACLIVRHAPKLSRKVIILLALLLSAGITVFLFLLVQGAHTYCVSDQLFVYLSAVDLYEECFDVKNLGDYFRTYPFQLGLVHIYGFLFRLFHSSAPLVLENVQAVCSGITYFTGFLITRELFQDKRIDCLYLICALPFVPFYLYTIFLYGECMGSCSALLAIYFFLLANRKQEKAFVPALPFWVLATVFLLFTVIVRSALTIVGIAFVILQFLRFLNKRKLLPLLLTLGVFLLALTGRYGLLQLAEKEAGLPPDSGAPASSWIVMGLQNSEMGPGYYNGYNTEAFKQCNYDSAAAAIQAKEDISLLLNQWLHKPIDFAFFLKDKGLYQWCEPSYAGFTVTRFMEEPEDWIYRLYWETLHDHVYRFLNHYQSMAYLCILMVFISSFGKKEENTLLLLPGLIFIGGFLFSLFWEGKSRYVYPYIIIIMPYFARGALICVEYFHHLKRSFLSHVKSRNKTIR